MFDLRRLHVLRVVHQLGTVAAAAGSLHLTPSAVSQQLRQLAHELDVKGRSSMSRGELEKAVAAASGSAPQRRRKAS